MLTLAVDTASQIGSVALFNNGQIVAEKSWQRQESHSELITSETSALLQENQHTLHDLNHLAVNLGPGSFTGIRVGINLIRTLGYCLNLPVLGINSLELVAQQLIKYSFDNNFSIENSNQLPTARIVQYAFRDLVYTASYQMIFDQGRGPTKVVERDPPRCLTFQDCLNLISAPTLVLGSGANLLIDLADSSKKSFLLRNPLLRDHSLSSDFGSFLALDEGPAHVNSWIHTIPLYIRASEAEEKLKSGLLKPAF